PTTALPTAVVGATASDDAGPTFTTALDCSADSGNVIGGLAPDQVWRFTAPDGGVYTFELEADFDSVLAVRGVCDADSAACLAVDTRLGANDVVKVSLDAGQTVFVVVDGVGTQAGAYL